MSARLPELVDAPIRQTTQRYSTATSACCIEQVASWMDMNCARLNATKIEIVWFGRGAVNFRQITLCGELHLG